MGSIHDPCCRAHITVEVRFNGAGWIVSVVPRGARRSHVDQDANLECRAVRISRGGTVASFRTFGRVLTIALVASAVAGCGELRGSQDAYSPDHIAKIKPALRFKSVIIRPFTVEKTVEEPGGAPSDCHQAAVDYLNQTRLFDSVEGDSTAAAPGILVVDGRVIDLRIVGAVARLSAGPYAGQSHMSVMVTARDGATGPVVAEQLIASENNPVGAALLFGASDRSLPRNLGMAMAKFVINTAQSPGPAVEAATATALMGAGGEPPTPVPMPSAPPAASGSCYPRCRTGYVCGADAQCVPGGGTPATPSCLDGVDCSRNAAGRVASPPTATAVLVAGRPCYPSCRNGYVCSVEGQCVSGDARSPGALPAGPQRR
jgi:hypothetical protein